MSKQIFIKHCNERIDAHYDIKNDKKEVLGKGSFGLVLKGVSKETKHERAIKVVRKEKIEDASKLQNETDIMKKMDHPNIIKLYEVYEDKKYVYFVMELCDGGELFEHIEQKQGDGYSEGECRLYFTQLMKAIQYMHSLGIAHRDIKPENLLFVKQGGNNLKLIDFGISKVFLKEGDGEAAIKLHTKAGSLFYISPEVLEGDYDQSCDIWSAGVILHLLLVGYPPFIDDVDSEVIMKIRSEKFDTDGPGWEKISESAKDLVLKMIISRDKRISAKDIMQHPWMTKEDGSSITHKLNAQGIKNFYKGEKLKRVALTAVASKLSEREIEELGAIFIKLDQDGDGQLSYQELTEGLKHFLKNDAVREILEVYKDNMDLNAKIKYNEFIASTIQMKLHYKNETQLRELFRILDKNQDGKITAQELREVLGQSDGYNSKPENFWDEMIKEVDTNGDGEVDYEEFVKMMLGNSLPESGT